MPNKLPHLEANIRKQVGEIIGEASVCWEEGKVPHGVFDDKHARELVERVMKLIDLEAPRLGCASTKELITELQARAEIGGYGDHRTID